MGTRWGREDEMEEMRRDETRRDETRQGVENEAWVTEVGGLQGSRDMGEASCTLGYAHECGSRRGAYRSAFPPY